MGYARSASLKTLQTSLSNSQRVVSIAARANFGGKRRSLFQDAMLSSAILLSFAQFENYISDLVNDFCKGLCAAGLSSSRMPSELRAQVAVASRLKDWSRIQDPTKLSNRIWKHKNDGDFDILNDQHTPQMLDVDALIASVGYPKLENVKRLLFRLGVKDPIAVLKKQGGYAIEQQLVSIHDARAELAHTGRLPAWSTQDYVDRIQGLEQFARAMDRVLCRHFCRYASLSNWIV